MYLVEAARLNDENNADDSEDNSDSDYNNDVDDDYDYDYDEEDEDDTNCDNSTSSGDCGFTNDPCGAASFAVNLVDDEDDDDDEGTSIAPLQKKKSTESDACSVDVCIPCLADTGVSVSNADRSAANERGKRRASKFQFFSGN